MLYLTLNRFMLSGIRFFGILFVIMGLVSCGTQPSKKPQTSERDSNSPLNSDNKSGSDLHTETQSYSNPDIESDSDNIQHTDKDVKKTEFKPTLQSWWGNSKHNDDKLLNKKIINNCNLPKISHNRYNKAGAWVHPFIRQKGWNDYINETNKSPFRKSVAVSIMPYLLDKENKKHLVYPDIKSGTNTFNNYSVVCNDEDNSNYYKVPQYYSTVMLTPIIHNTTQYQINKKKLYDELDKKLTTLIELTDTFVDVPITNNYTMKELLMKIISDQNNIGKQLRQLISLKVNIMFKGIDKKKNNWTLYPTKITENYRNNNNNCSLHISPFSCKVTFNLPFGMNIEADKCKRISNTRKYECNISKEDIQKAANKNGRKEFKLNLGNGWEENDATVSVDINKNRSSPYINARPIWPFSNQDYWWQWQGVRHNKSDNSSCNIAKAKYAIKSVTYSNSKKNNRKKYSFDKHKNMYNRENKQLPTLKQIGWNDAQLPDTVTLKLQQQGNPTAAKYRHNTEITWKLSDVSGSHKWNLVNQYQEQLEEKERKVNLSTSNLNLSGRRNYALYKFSSMESCKKSIEGIDGIEVSYSDGQQTLSIKPCSNSYFKFIDTLNSKPISRCAQPKSGLVSFQPYEYHGKRKLIVVALSEKLDKYNNQIKNALKNAFQTNQKPFNLVTITSGRALSEELLQCEDIAGFNNDREMEKFISQKLTKMRFGADDLDAWQNLEIVDLGYRSKLDKFAAIFYVTDEVYADIDHIYKYAQYSKKWRDIYQVPMTVITAGSCQNWRTHANASCEHINNIERVLKNFLR